MSRCTAPLLALACLLVATVAHGRSLRGITVSASASASANAGTASTGTTLPTTITPTVFTQSVSSGTTLPGLSPIPWPKLPTAPTLPTTGTTIGTPSLRPSPQPTTSPDPQQALSTHNVARARRGAAPLTWSTSLAAGAQAYANRCSFQHSNTNGVGENLYWSSGSASSCAAAVERWVSEAPLYTGTYSSATGHWTQIVWRGTTAVGCGLARCGASSTMVVCWYSPQGNIIGQFSTNV